MEKPTFPFARAELVSFSCYWLDRMSLRRMEICMQGVLLSLLTILFQRGTKLFFVELFVLASVGIQAMLFILGIVTGKDFTGLMLIFGIFLVIIFITADSYLSGNSSKNAPAYLALATI